MDFSTNLLACDPGSDGGFAWANDCWPMPETNGDIIDLLTKSRINCDTLVMEEVGGFIKGNAAPGSAMFKFGKGCGIIEGAAMALGYRVIMVKPQKWQKHFSLGTVKAAGGKTQWKNKLKAEAQRRFPHHLVTLNTADALLILDWASASPLA